MCLRLLVLSLADSALPTILRPARLGLLLKLFVLLIICFVFLEHCCNDVVVICIIDFGIKVRKMRCGRFSCDIASGQVCYACSAIVV